VQLTNGLSIRPTVSWPSHSVPHSPTIAPTLAILVPSVHPIVSSLFFFFHGFDPQNIYYLLILASGIFASLGPINVYKDMASTCLMDPRVSG
jgi:hypothetical protein